jgi:hypothetical protein
MGGADPREHQAHAEHEQVGRYAQRVGQPLEKLHAKDIAPDQDGAWHDDHHGKDHELCSARRALGAQPDAGERKRRGVGKRRDAK